MKWLICGVGLVKLTKARSSDWYGLVCGTEKPVVHTPSTPLVVGQSVELSCNVSFGGPEMDATSPPDTVGMFPQVRMSLGPDRPLDSSVTPQHSPGRPGVSSHQLTLVCTHLLVTIQYLSSYQSNTYWLDCQLSGLMPSSVQLTDAVCIIRPLKLMS